jgi:hypothetical protein
MLYFVLIGKYCTLKRRDCFAKRLYENSSLFGWEESTSRENSIKFG